MAEGRRSLLEPNGWRDVGQQKGPQVHSGGVVRPDPGGADIRGSPARSNCRRSMLESREEGVQLQDPGQRVEMGLSTLRLEAEPRAQTAQEGLAPRMSKVEPRH